MGSPLGPTLANIFMGYIELKVVHVFKNNLLYLRYVDDCFVLVKIEEVMDEFLNILNVVRKSINFTIEYKNNNAFLMYKLNEKKKLTSVFRIIFFYNMLFEFSIEL